MLVQRPPVAVMDTSVSGRSQSAGGAPSLRKDNDDDEDLDFRYHSIDQELSEEIRLFAEEKKRRTMVQADEESWRDSIKQKLEHELNCRVREALETPPPQKQQFPPGHGHSTEDGKDLEQLNAHISLGELSMRERELYNSRRWKVLQAKRQIKRLMSNGHMSFNSAFDDDYPERAFFDEFDSMKDDDYQQLINSYSTSYSQESAEQRHRNRSQDFYTRLANKAFKDYGNLSETEKMEFFYVFTRGGFREAMRTGRLPDGSELEMLENGKCRDRFGIIRDQHGPFWPADFGPLYPAPELRKETESSVDPLTDPQKPEKYPSVETNPVNTKYSNKWRGVVIIYDSEKSSRDYSPREVTDGLCPSLTFESRFECGNLRQARRIGAFDYELVLKTDLYTTRHTQWYYFRVENAMPGVTYRFKIINLHKRDSLYNHGMRPLLYSEKNASKKNMGWHRIGHHITYSRNTTNLQCPLLMRDRNYYTLEWQMEFPHADDTCYLAHCYPYTFTDLRDDLDTLLADPERSKVMKRQVMCESRAGNSCFLITVTNFESSDHSDKKIVVVTARVHPGETNSSWMMKGLLDYVTGSSNTAKQLRDRLIFKIVPMLNPDGVIVGNYRCSLAARDLNRNYRHPRKESFPTIWFTKAMMSEVSQWNEIVVYCDLHGHSRKHNVFMYGCNTAARAGPGHQAAPQSVSPEDYIQERLFPWLMAQKAPDKFWFRGCKFQVRRCKESTGRVVMFRQLKISNSFTMEATFCGTTISRGEQRHFNTLDYQEMGRVFCECALDYDQLHKNMAHQSEVILELTRAITQQILETRGLLPLNLPDFTTERGKHQLKDFTLSENSGTEQIATAFISMVTKDKSPPESISGEKSDSEKERDESASKDLTKLGVHQLLDLMSSQTIDGCAQLLEQLHVAEAMAESDSSDSDSESEPEMQYVDSKSRRRKKKNKKKHRNGTDSADKSKVDTQNEALASLAQPLERRRSDATTNFIFGNKYMGLPAIDSESQKRKKQGVNQGKLSGKAARNYPGYVNKYQGRSNGGIPCFSQERLHERATKRMNEMRKRMEDDQRRGSFHLLPDEDIMSQQSSAADGGNMVGPFQRYKSSTELRKQFSQLLQSGPGSGGGIRMGYMHAIRDQMQYPEVPAVLDTTSLGPQVSGLLAPQNDDSSSSSESENEELPPRLPLAAMRTPYQHLPHALHAGNLLHPLHRRLGRLPALTHKSVSDSCSIPRRHSVISNMVVTALPGKADSAPVTTATDTSQSRAKCRRKSLPRNDPQALEPVIAPQGVGLVTREYTDLLLQRLRNHKISSTSLPTQVTGQVSRTSERHSTCE